MYKINNIKLKPFRKEHFYSTQTIIFNDYCFLKIPTLSFNVNPAENHAFLQFVVMFLYLNAK